MALSAHDIAKYFIAIVDDEAGDSLSNLKLQKLLYYSQGFHLAIFGRALFPEAIKKGAHGPIIEGVYHTYEQYRSTAIPKEPIDLNLYGKSLRELLNEVQHVYGQFTASKLRSMTQQEPPWRETTDNEEIPHDSMKRFFNTLVLQRQAFA